MTLTFIPAVTSTGMILSAADASRKETQDLPLTVFRVARSAAPSRFCLGGTLSHVKPSHEASGCEAMRAQPSASAATAEVHLVETQTSRRVSICRQYRSSPIPPCSEWLVGPSLSTTSMHALLLSPNPMPPVVGRSCCYVNVLGVGLYRAALHLQAGAADARAALGRN